MSALGQTCLQHLVQLMRASVNTVSAHLVWHACTAPSTVHQLSSWPFGKAAKLHPWKAWYSPGRNGNPLEGMVQPWKAGYTTGSKGTPWEEMVQPLERMVNRQEEWYTPGSQGIALEGRLYPHPSSSTLGLEPRTLQFPVQYPSRSSY